MSIGYYFFNPDHNCHGLNACSKASEDHPLMVNCTGNVVTPFPFTTENPTGREDFYLIYMVKGSMNVAMPEEILRAEAGNIMLFPPRYPYRYSYRGGEELNYLWVHFTGSYAQKLLEECGLAPLPALKTISCHNSIIAEFNRMFEIFERKSSLQQQELACTLEQLLVNIALSVSKESQNHSLDRSIRHIHSFYNTPLRIPELAKMENLSHSRYVDVFRAKMGIPPTAYIVKLRINAACDLLQNTDMSIKQIALLVGYDDPHFFSKLFKKYIGTAPQSYRKQI